MNKHRITNTQLSGSALSHCGAKLLATTLGIALYTSVPLFAADAVNATTVKVDVGNAVPTEQSVSKKIKAKKTANGVAIDSKLPLSAVALTELVPKMELSLGQSHLVRLQSGVNLQKVKVEDDKIVQVEVTSPREVVIHAKTIGSTVVIVWDKSGKTAVMDVSVVGVTVAVDAAALQAKLQQTLPGEKGVKVSTAADSIVLTGSVTDAVKVDKVLALAEAYAGKESGKKVINMLQVSAPQQVMLEVKMAEVSKNMLDKLGAELGASRVNGGVAYAIASGFLSLGAGAITLNHGNTHLKIDAEDKNSVVKILAEPNIIAISGQEGSFLAGGKFYIPVPQGGSAAGAITLEEKNFGVGLRFTPTVLEDGLINLRVAPEVTELAKSEDVAGTTIASSSFPSLITRRVSTTVQLHDGQSFAIAGLLKNNVTENIKRFPILGNIPILGALFRSSSFQNEKTELLFVVTPRLVKPLSTDYKLPTDNFNAPSKSEFFLNGQLEAKPTELASPTIPPDNATISQSGAVVHEPKNAQDKKNRSNLTQDGFEMK
jgi:pilus assembly protein CpaC